MRLLLSNDDGVDAPGLAALADGLRENHEVWVVAPATEQSAKSHSFTMHDPLRVQQLGPRRYAVSGTPADSVYVALHGLLSEPPDMVISGINHGSNLGTDVHYSGTVAAAREGTLQGHPAIAVSLVSPAEGERAHWEAAVEVVERAIGAMHRAPPPRGVFWSINVPNLPSAELRGLKVCRLGDRVYAPMVDRRSDPRGRLYVWIGGPHVRFEGGDDTDGNAVEAGWASITPLSAAITATDEMERLRDWTDD
ncbi:MAG: 5'/3'-nucleotidase SurE [Myxococcales bacterium]|nr:5'/3'-nucleotidase SurE [Myxococcales bacterium]